MTTQQQPHRNSRPTNHGCAAACYAPYPFCSQVSSLATELRHRYNGQVAVVDDGTEHPHRLSLTMKSDVSDRVTQKWSDGLKEKGVKVNCSTVLYLGESNLYVCTCCFWGPSLQSDVCGVGGCASNSGSSQLVMSAPYASPHHGSFLVAEEPLHVRRSMCDVSLYFTVIADRAVAASNGGQHWWRVALRGLHQRTRRQGASHAVCCLPLWHHNRGCRRCW